MVGGFSYYLHDLYSVTNNISYPPTTGMYHVHVDLYPGARPAARPTLVRTYTRRFGTVFNFSCEDNTHMPGTQHSSTGCLGQ